MFTRLRIGPRETAGAASPPLAACEGPRQNNTGWTAPMGLDRGRVFENRHLLGTERVARQLQRSPASQQGQVHFRQCVSPGVCARVRIPPRRQ